MNIAFPSMNTFNRVVQPKQPKFGESQPGIVDVNEANFEQEVVEASKNQPVLVKFYADWCGPCQRYAPEFMSHADSSSANVKSAQFNAGPKSSRGKLKVGRTMMKYGVVNIPTTILFKNGEPVEKFVGVHTQAEINEKIIQHL